MDYRAEYEKWCTDSYFDEDTKAELKALYETCQKLGLPVYLDGARLGYGLMSEGSDLTWKDVAEYTDAFYIGGTKVGAFCGEAVVCKKQGYLPPRHLACSSSRNVLCIA